MIDFDDFFDVNSTDDLPIDNSDSCTFDSFDFFDNDMSLHQSLSECEIDSELQTEMDAALNNYDNTANPTSTDNISFLGQSHHEPMDGEPEKDPLKRYVSFEGNGDIYSDNDYNRKEADKWLSKEADLLAKGDTTGASAAHKTAMKHISRIKK